MSVRPYTAAMAALVLGAALGLASAGCSSPEAPVELEREELLEELHYLADGKPIPQASESEEEGSEEAEGGHGEAKAEEAEGEHAEGKEGGHAEGKEGGHGEEAELGPLLEDGIRWVSDGRAELGWFRAGTFEPASRLTLQAEFRLAVATRAKNAEEFTAFIAPRQHALREQVLLTVRAAKPAELYRPELDRLAARIQIALGRVAGEGYFTSVKLEDFLLLESLDGSPFQPARPHSASKEAEHSGTAEEPLSEVSGEQRP